MAEPEVLVVRTGTANLASVLAGLKRAGAEPRVTEDPRDVLQAGRLVLPGVGTLGAAMERLRATGLVEPLRARIGEGRPILAVCLGMQLLAKASDESEGARGLGAVESRATRFPAGLRVPQLGWNRIVPEPGCSLLEEGYVYFANSFRFETPPGGWKAAMADYGGPFVAAMERGPQLACQFHPELSGRFGLELIRRWLETTGAKGGGSC
jgi:imidazole glycerol phosphate synthase glutamine amidotransferase subunit